MTNILTREQILQAEDIEKVTVQVPEWGGSVIVSSMTGTQRDEFEAAIMASSGQKNYRALILSFSIIDDEGNLVFSKEDVQALGNKSVAALERCVRVAQRLNALTQEDLNQVKQDS